MRGPYDANVIKVQVTVTLLIFRYVFICFHVYNVGNAVYFIITCITDHFSAIKTTQMNAVLINSGLLRINRKFEYTSHCIIYTVYLLQTMPYLQLSLHL